MLRVLKRTASMRWFFWAHKTYSKTCVKRPLKKDKSKILMTNGSLMKVESTGIIGIENQFLVFLRVAVLHRFYCMCKLVDKKTITIL